MQNFQMFNQVVSKVTVRLKRLTLHQFSPTVWLLLHFTPLKAPLKFEI